MSGTAQTGFTTTSASYIQTTPFGTIKYMPNGGIANNVLYGELSLPATTASASAATVDIDYPMNFALPPGYRIFVGLGTTVSAGWIVIPIAGKY